MGETTFDRNVVVLAGAGTGKTTLLVNRLLHALLREPHSFQVTEILALTFTNKAANEMKARLREALYELFAACQSPSPAGDVASIKLQEFQERYQVSREHIQEKITRALHDLEKAHIATLHSFAAHVLRLYPLESGVDPQFQEDDGTQFLEIFSGVWTSWLDEALGEQGGHQAQWREILDVIDLQAIRAMALVLCDDLIDLSALYAQLDATRLSPALESWCKANQDKIAFLLHTYTPSKPRKVEKMVSVAQRVFDLVTQEGWEGAKNITEDETALLSSALGPAPKGWLPDDFRDARRIIQSAHRLTKVDERFLGKVVRLLQPFIQQVRRLYANKGWIRFDGLIVRVRDVLRDFPSVREQLKRDFQAILVDEFQDTDPVQYEILLYLGEQFGDHGLEWDAIRLVPGKLFIVGDPKQSIYAFRRADIQAFDHVVRKLTDDGGVVCTLRSNFRSDQAVLDVVNAVFDRVLVQEDHVQPPNVPLLVGRRGEDVLPGAGVELFAIANGGEEEWDAERATRVEAEWLAGWIQEHLSSGQQWVLEKGRRTALRPGHVAVLFRKFTNAHVYLEAMQRRGVPFLTDGERHFYRRQEVIDCVNVLRVLDDPRDAVAIVGVLRSALGGVPDQEIMKLARLGPLDICRADLLDQWESIRKPGVRLLFEQLKILSVLAKRIPIAECLERVFAQLPIVELAAASSHGEQAVMNVWKLRDLMVEKGAVPHLSFSALVQWLVDSLINQPSEPEASLEEESLDAVRVLSIHKAKGLEFPVVLLPGLHQQSAGMDRGAEVTVDWMSGMYGCRFPPTWNVGQVFLWEKERIREKAEQRRVMYVGMTRARDRLILSGGQLTKPIGESFLGFLQQVADNEVGNPEQANVRIGEAAIRQTVVTSRDVAPVQRMMPPQEFDTSDHQHEAPVSFDVFRERETAWLYAAKKVPFLTPSLLQSSSTRRIPSIPSNGVQVPSRYLGTLVHQLLEQWDFQLDLETFRKPLGELCGKILPDDLAHEEKQSLVFEIEGLMEAFLQSSSYQELQQSTVLGREVPFAVPWAHQPEGHPTAHPCVMEGVIDVVFENGGDVWVGDYKTDKVTAAQVHDYAQVYRPQAQVYVWAASRSLGLDVKGCKLIFLRIGEMVSVLTDGNAYP